MDLSVFRWMGRSRRSDVCLILLLASCNQGSTPFKCLVFRHARFQNSKQFDTDGGGVVAAVSISRVISTPQMKVMTRFCFHKQQNDDQDQPVRNRPRKHLQRYLGRGRVSIILRFRQQAPLHKCSFLRPFYTYIHNSLLPVARLQLSRANLISTWQTLPCLAFAH